MSVHKSLLAYVALPALALNAVSVWQQFDPKLFEYAKDFSPAAAAKKLDNLLLMCLRVATTTTRLVLVR
jgi:hypothetical protein